MIKKSLKYYLLLILVVFLPLSSCGPKYKAGRTQKQFEKRVEKRKKEGEKAVSEGKRRHMDMQDRDAQQRMKQTLRKSEQLRKQKYKNRNRPPIFKRWFSKSR